MTIKTIKTVTTVVERKNRKPFEAAICNQNGIIALFIDKSSAEKVQREFLSYETEVVDCTVE